jgi:hypothetical protein
MTVTSNGADLADALELQAQGHTVNWIVQPLPDFTLGGAVYADPRTLYVEAASGSPVGLLRRGELRMAAYLGDEEWQESAEQATQWRYEGSELVARQRLTHIPPSILSRVCRKLQELVRVAGVGGPLEWGFDDGQIYFLDWKMLESTGVLSEFVRNELFPTMKCSEPSNVLKLPDLELAKSIPLNVCIRCLIGARLSHAVTHRCAQGSSANTFSGW